MQMPESVLRQGSKLYIVTKGQKISLIGQRQCNPLPFVIFKHFWAKGRI